MQYMGKVNLPYLQAVKANGTIYYRYRRAGYPLIRIKGEPGTIEFSADYQKIHDSFEAKRPHSHVIVPGSITELIIQYKTSADFNNLAKKTQSEYRKHLDKVQAIWGRFQVSSITRKLVLSLRDSLQHMPATANGRIAVIRLLLSYAVDRGYIKINPALKPRKLKTGTWEPWQDDQITIFMKAAADGKISSGVLTAVMLALYTGQRQGDVLKATYNDIRLSDGAINVRQNKNGKFLVIPLHSKLRTHLSSVKGKSLLLVTTVRGMQYREDNFRHDFREEMNAIGLNDCVFHGLRKNALNNLLEAGCSTSEASAITGQSLQMVEHYSKGVNQVKLAMNAITHLERNGKKYE